MTIAPALPHPWPWVVLVAAPLLGGWLAWRANQPLPLLPRSTLTFLRVAIYAVLALLLLNPGRWLEPETAEEKVTAILIDRSASMAVPDAEGGSRWTRAMTIARTLATHGGDDARVFAFSNHLEGDALVGDLAPDGEGSAIVKSGIDLFSGAAGLGRALSGIVIISDGRQTQEDPAEELLLRATAAAVPVHVVPLGTDWGGKDLRLRAVRRLVMALPDKPVTVAVQIENRGLGKIRPRLQLTDESGKVFAEAEVELLEGDQQTIMLEAANLPGGDYRVSAARQSGEDVTRNNEDRVRVQEMKGRTRVFIAEGAPYWDSKFLAQLLREQGFMDVRAVYRLNEQRYFRVDAGKSELVATETAVFPETAEDFAALDVIVLGKGVEGFLTPKRIEALKTFVRDRGGALLMARGKAVASPVPSLTVLEPADWGATREGEFRFAPGSLGEAAGLFGQALPSADDGLWRELPALRDVAEVVRLKPFTQVMAVGEKPGLAGSERVPLLLARHFGRGVVVALNADGLWRWDFDPKARKLGNLYEEFWTQLLQWTASYAEFLPGQDLSLRLSASTVKQGSAVRAVIGWRGTGAVPQPQVVLSLDGKKVAELTAGEGETDEEGRRSWTALLQPADAGTYRVQVHNGGNPGPEVVLHVEPPPTEAESLAANPDFLRELAQGSGGKVWAAEQSAELARVLFDTPPAQLSRAADAEWQPLWPRGWLLCVLAGVLGVEWWSRRRQGLL